MDLYLVAVLPPEPVLGQVWALKQEVHERTGSRNAIRLPPHITLIPPTRQATGFEAQATAVLSEFARNHSPCNVGLHNFSWFGTRTLFVRVVETQQLLVLHAALQTWCSEQLPTITPEKRSFTPHMTLATRDLPPAAVPALQEEFSRREYQAAFLIKELYLFKHNGQNWENIEQFPLDYVAG
ncbi:2'-5' RNA ligase family protein [Hymenobacter taeanensis]|uniref:2'-5' RNA ligase family protein n=1 Tax=Hymenobacter taeanensis TaxID=2735321 RepID=A0A6M6BN31_9BACT|nr:MULTISPECIES: 2'-5' RNA ligase family protein [Hymenobacter]QJX48485.1 2'-5' RNA ligase family protein [Hymenobacter taeanensis]UOQ82018.1 2'-5' RNA ligase family protein [Hymenobacter sp. 5414T-23]